jgi:hypothetical protein
MLALLHPAARPFNSSDIVNTKAKPREYEYHELLLMDSMISISFGRQIEKQYWREESIVGS